MANLKLFHISELVGRLTKAAEENRYDQVTRNVHSIFEAKAAASPEAIISSQELRNVYGSFSGLNPQSNFRDYFDDVFGEEKTATASAQQNKLVFARDESYSEEFRPSVLEYQPKVDDQIKAASLIEIKQVVAGVVDNPQFRFKGITRVANTGGFANWSVSFETGHGIAEIDVPVILTDEAAYAPQKFTSANGAFTFSKEGIRVFAKQFDGSKPKKVAKSGVEWLGSQSVIPENMFTQAEAEQIPVLEVTSLGGAMPLDESTTASIDGMEQSTVNAVVTARKAALEKLSLAANGKSVNNNVQLTYAGAVRFEDQPNDENTFSGVIAFNASKNTRLGTRVITIPVEVRGKVHVAETFVDQAKGEHALNATSVNDYFNAAGETTDGDSSEASAFNDAFLASMASFADLRNEIRVAIASCNMPRANAAIKAVSNRFDDQALRSAMDDYLEAINKKASNKTLEDEFNSSLLNSGVIL